MIQVGVRLVSGVSGRERVLAPKLSHRPFLHATRNVKWWLATLAATEFTGPPAGRQTGTVGRPRITC